MTADEAAIAVDRLIGEAPCVVFAYHEIGFACMKELIGLSAPILALFTHRDKPGEEIWWRSCTELARTCGIPIFTPEKLDSGWIARIGAMKPSIIYSFYYRNLLPAEVLRLAPLGAYNLHGSMLPKYRGRAPVNWMIANGEREAGATLHHMVPRADAGDIVAQRPVTITDDDTALTLYRKIVPIAATIVRECHPLIAAGRAPRRPQLLNDGSYYGRRRPEDGRIDWTWPARRIFNLVRAVTHPYPGAFCMAGGRKLFIWRAAMSNESGSYGAPGMIIGTARESGAEVAAGDGSLTLMSVQFESEPEADAAQVLKMATGRWITERLD
ncbi:MAG TPA: formyltransferase [Candidatus Binataceae bacterium]|nr:formyltransferase [Candidatus Binataceae bacterium]